MGAIAAVLIVIALVIACKGNDWLTIYWNGKAETNYEKRLIAEANAKEAEAKLALTRINAA